MANADEVAREAAANWISPSCARPSTPPTHSARRSRSPARQTCASAWDCIRGGSPTGERRDRERASRATRSRDAASIRRGRARFRSPPCRETPKTTVCPRPHRLRMRGPPREGRVLSIHAVQAAGESLDILERHRLTASANCIFHWFSGTSDSTSAGARRRMSLFDKRAHARNQNEDASTHGRSPSIGSCWKPTCPNSWTSLAQPTKSKPPSCAHCMSSPTYVAPTSIRFPPVSPKRVRNFSGCSPAHSISSTTSGAIFSLPLDGSATYKSPMMVKMP